MWRNNNEIKSKYSQWRFIAYSALGVRAAKQGLLFRVQINRSGFATRCCRSNLMSMSVVECHKFGFRKDQVK